MKRRWIIIATLILMIFSPYFGNASESSTISQDNWDYPFPATVGHVETLFYDQDNVSIPSFLLDTSTVANIYPNDPTCRSTSDPKCSLQNFRFSSMLPLCKTAKDINCLAGIGAIGINGKKIKGKFLQNFPLIAENQFEGNPDWKLPSGASGELFSIPGTYHNAGNTYYVSASVRGTGGKNLKPIIQKSSFDLNIIPVSVQDENWDCTNSLDCQNSGYNQFVDPNGKTVWGIFGAKWAQDKTIIEYSTHENKSLHRMAFPKDNRFYADVRLNFSPTGWLHGRLLDPNLSISKVGKIYNLHFEGSPVRVPIAFASVDWATANEDLKSRYDKDASYICKEGGVLGNCVTAFSRLGGFLDYAEDPLQTEITFTPFASGIDGIDQLNLWLPSLNNTASAVLSYWGVRTLSPRENIGANKCFSDNSKITGIVTTNSTEYSAGPPEFVKSTGVLDYKVAAPHFEPNKDAFLGTYNLIIRNEVAQCLYGFKNAPVRVDISVINEKGEKSVAITTFSQDKNWIRLKASNFEFSSPTIKVKLSKK
jgi:hypothetical protein